ncbi:hypothetical protein [Pseudomonas sp. N2-5-1-1]|uniref:hypothetical protein n=1 Tax=Pseudomonas sp. N2-5-1-1 TaxID=3239189 RepID=UPI0034E0B278
MLPILPLTFVLLGFSSAAVYASVTDFPDAQASGPARLKWMVGALPPPDRTVRFNDGSYFRFPAMRWSVANWSRLGSEQDAYFTVDSIGTPFAGSGLNAGLQDMARFGEMLRNGGRFNGQQIVPESVVKDIRQGGDKEAFAKAGYSQLKGWSYRAMWWVTHNPDGAYMARGVHGQSIYIHPAAEMVIVRFASHPVAANAANDGVTLPAYAALARYLLEKPGT